MVEYYNGQLCIPARELIGKVMSEPTYKQLSARKKITVARPGKGLGNYALVVVDTMPDKYRAAVTELYPHADKMRLLEWIRQNYALDTEARSFFSSFVFPDSGKPLPPAKQNEYTVNASVIRCVIRLKNNATALRQASKCGTMQWDDMAQVIAACKEEFGHTLPESTLRFRKKVAEFNRSGYMTLISDKFGNQNKRKVTHRIEQLLFGIACLPNKPFDTSTWEMYNQFVCGELDVYDPTTGELFDPEKFCDKNGEPITLSEATVNNYLNTPRARALINSRLKSWSTFMHEDRPHVHRERAEWSFSKISFDDRDLPRKLKDTKARPKVYYAYDVASGAVVGRAYSRTKDIDLVTEMFRDMFRLIQRNGWNCPGEVEVENHLMSQWRNGFLQAGVMFPFVRFCAPLNSQEKYAETGNRVKKLTVEHRNHLGIGRFYAKDEAYRTESLKMSTADNDTYEEKQYYSWEQLIAEDMADVNEYNNALHSNQKKYPGMTRWQVLVERMNPNLHPFDEAVAARYIGEHVTTSVRRNSYCRVCYKDWWLSSPDVLDKLAHHDYTLDAYYLTDDCGNPTNVYVYQNGAFIDCLKDIGTFKDARIEQTDQDREVFVEQQKHIAQFDAKMKREAIQPVAVMKGRPLRPEPAEAVGTVAAAPHATEEDFTTMDYAAMAKNDF